MDEAAHRLEQLHSDAIALYRVDARSRAAQTVAFKELFAWTLAIRDALRASSSRPTASLRVAIALPPCSINETALVLAVAQEARWLYVPIDAALPLARQVQTLQDARVTVLVTLPASPLAQFLAANAETLLDAPPQTVLAAACAAFEDLGVFRLRVLPLADRQAPRPDSPTPTPTLDGDEEESRCDPLYILYTSGSTGQPKGVIGTRAGALQRLEWMWTQFPFAAPANTERVARVTKLTFVDSVWEILGALLQGVPLVHIGASETAAAPRNSVVLDQTALFVHAVATLHVSRFTIVPSVLEVLLRQYAALPLRAQLGDALASVRFVLASGEALPLSLARDAIAAFPHVRLLNLYGSTEVSGDVAWFEVTAPLTATDEQRWRSHGVPIGRVGHAVGDTKLMLVDSSTGERHVLQVSEQLASSAPSVREGELYVAGTALAIGYTATRPPEQLRRSNCPSARAKWIALRDTTHEQGASGTTTWFRTGDVCRVLDDTIFFCGRTDALVKIRGQRLQLEAVERILDAALAHVDATNSVGVVGTVALATRDSSAFRLSSQSLVALVIVHGTSGTAALVPYPHRARLVQWIRDAFGDAYVPHDVVCVQERAVERLGTGKLDKAALWALYERSSASPPQTSLLASDASGKTRRSRAQQFVDVHVARVLGLAAVADDAMMRQTFQALGGNSLHATLVSWEAQRAFGSAMPAHELLSSPLAAFIASLERAAEQSERSDLVPEAFAAAPTDSDTVAAPLAPVARRAPPTKRPRLERGASHEQQRHVSIWSLARRNETACGDPFVPSVRLTNALALTIALDWCVDLGKCIDASPLVVQRFAALPSPSRSTASRRALAASWVVIGSHSATLACVDVARQGAIVWTRQLDDRIEASAALSERTMALVIGTYSGALYALDLATGATKWIFRASDAIKAAALVLDDWGLVVCGAYDHVVYGIDSASGKQRWTLSADGGSVFSTPVLVRTTGHVVFATTRGLVRCIALRRDSEPPDRCWDCQLPAPVFSSLSLVADSLELVLVGCADGSLYALRLASGDVHWRIATRKPVFSSPCVYACSGSGNRKTTAACVVFGSHDGCLRKASCASGHVEWTRDLGSPIFGSPTVFEAASAATPRAARARLLCCVGTTDGTLVVCDEATGAIVARVRSAARPASAEEEDPTPARPLGALFSSPVVLDNVCLIGSRSNELLAFRIASD